LFRDGVPRKIFLVSRQTTLAHLVAQFGVAQTSKRFRNTHKVAGLGQENIGYDIVLRE